MKALKRTDFRILVFLKIVLEVEKIALEPPLPCASLCHGHITQTGNRESLPILLCCLSSFMIQIINIKASERLFSCVVINYLKKFLIIGNVIYPYGTLLTGIQREGFAGLHFLYAYLPNV